MRVVRSAQSRLSDDSVAIATEISAAIVFFYEGETDIDVDNIAKPVLDSLAGLAYEDDSQVSQITVRKTALAAGLAIDNPSPSLTAALAIGGDFIYVRIGEPPDHRKIPDGA